MSSSEYQSFLPSKGGHGRRNSKAESECCDSPRTVFSNKRNARAQATSNLMMRMAPSALQAIRQEFYAREDSVSLTEFVHIMSKHLFNNQSDDISSSSQVKNQDIRSFGSDMIELFKEVDVNGDGQMEWDEFTKFTVEKASSLNQNMVMTSIPEYFDNTAILDTSAKQFRRGNITAMVPILNTGLFAVLEEHRKAISLYHSSNGALYNEIKTESVPIAIEALKGTNLMAAVFTDLSLSTFQVDDNHTIPQKRNLIKSTLPTPDIQMSVAWMSSSELLYTGASSGDILSWNMSKNQLVSTMNGHNDKVMKCLALDSLDSLMSASLDMTIGVWDTYTNTVIHKLKGHRKGVFSMSYNPDFRLLVSSGFDHEALVWSPFVNSLVFKLKGHHSSLVGCQCVENTPELITADEAGVFKLWDVRTFQCIQTFYNNSNTENEPAEHLSCFFHSKIPTSSLNQQNKNPDIDDCLLFAGSRRIRCFEQKRIVHAKTTDLTNVIWTDVNDDALTIITVSERNIIIWDLLLGSKIIVHNDMCKEEISACCLDDRKRKIIIGDIFGGIRVYNPLNGSYMKSCIHDIQSVVVSLAYVAHSRRFLAGYVNGIMRLYDETNLDDCQILRNFDRFNFHSELCNLLFLEADRTVVTVGTLGEPVKFWEYDSGKCDMELQACDKSETIIAVITLDPFPLVATSDSAGNIVVWGSRGCKYRGDIVTAFKNQHPLEAEMEPPLRTNGPRRIVPENREASQRSLVSNDELEGQKVEDQLPSLLSMPSTDWSSYANKAEDELKACALKWGPLSAAATVAWDPENHYFYTADEQGTLRAFSFEHIIDELDGEAMLHGTRSNRDAGSSKRRAKAVSSKSTAHAIPHYFGKKKFTAHSIPIYRWGIQAHRETVIYCRSTPYGILTSSTDNKVKMWDIHGTEVGSLMSCAPTGKRSIDWDIKLNIENIMEKEEKQLDAMLDQVKQYDDEVSNVDLAELSDHASSNGSVVGDEKKSRFSRTSLRKRIEMSSRLLGLDFTCDQIAAMEDASDTDSVSVSVNDDSSAVSSTSKSTKNALDEARNIHNQTDLVTKKDRTLTVTQMKYKDNAMKNMVKSFEERGVSFPALKKPKNPKQNYGVVKDTTVPIVPGSIKVGLQQELEREEKMSNKCKKFSTYKHLEKSLGSEFLPPLSKEERDKIRNARKEQRRLRELKDAKNTKEIAIVKQNSKSVDNTEAVDTTTEE